MTQDADDDAPRRARNDDKDGDLALVGRAVLINRPRSELFAFWCDFTRLPSFMHAIERIEMTGERRARWTVKAPVGQTVTLETEITELVENELIGWTSTPQSQIETTGRVTFADAPADRGTVVTADIGYKPPGGDLGRLVAKLFVAEPNIQARHELKRFKMLMETGEVATGASYRASERGDQ
ncbi:cyclase [Nostoc sp. 3335mG]|nr:cyclase [Nostoc sp. 3335mG]